MFVIVGFLWQILCELSALHSNASNETGVQTDLIRVAAVSSLGMYELSPLYSTSFNEIIMN